MKQLCQQQPNKNNNMFTFLDVSSKHEETENEKQQQEYCRYCVMMAKQKKVGFHGGNLQVFGKSTFSTTKEDSNNNDIYSCCCFRDDDNKTRAKRQQQQQLIRSDHPHRQGPRKKFVFCFTTKLPRLRTRILPKDTIYSLYFVIIILSLVRLPLSYSQATTTNDDNNNYYSTCINTIFDTSQNNMSLSRGEFNMFIWNLSVGTISIANTSRSMIAPITRPYFLRENNTALTMSLFGSSSTNDSQLYYLGLFCHDIYNGFLSYYNLSSATINATSCVKALQIADTDPQNGRLMPYPEYLTFITALFPSYSMTANSFPALPLNLQQAFTDMAINGEIRGPKGVNYLLEFCQRVAINIAIDTILRQSPDINVTSSPSINNNNNNNNMPTLSPVISMIPTVISTSQPQQTPEEEYITCKTAMLISDLNRDDVLSTDEYVRFLNRLTNNEFFDISYVQLDPMFRNVYVNYTDPTSAVLNISGSKPGDTPTSEQNNHLQSFCGNVFSTIKTYDDMIATQVPTSMTNNNVSTVMTLPMLLVCQASLTEANENNDIYLNQSEYVAFIKSMIRNDNIDNNDSDDNTLTSDIQDNLANNLTDLPKVFQINYDTLILNGDRYININGSTRVIASLSNPTTKQHFYKVCQNTYSTLFWYKYIKNEDNENKNSNNYTLLPDIQLCMQTIVKNDVDHDNRLNETEYLVFIQQMYLSKSNNDNTTSMGIPNYNQSDWNSLPFLLSENFDWIASNPLCIGYVNLEVTTMLTPKANDTTPLTGSNDTDTNSTDISNDVTDYDLQIEWICTRTNAVLDTLLKSTNVNQETESPSSPTSPDEKMEDYCMFALASADIDKDNLITPDEYIDFIKLYTNSGWQGETFDSLSTDVQFVYDTAVNQSGGYLFIEGASKKFANHYNDHNSNNGTTRSQEDNNLKQFCDRFAIAIRSSYYNESFFEKCLLALSVSNTNNDYQLNESEYSHFIYSLAISEGISQEILNENELDLSSTLNYKLLTGGSNTFIDVTGLSSIRSLTSGEHFRFVCDSTKNLIRQGIQQVIPDNSARVVNGFIIANNISLTSINISKSNIKYDIELAYAMFIDDTLSDVSRNQLLRGTTGRRIQEIIGSGLNSAVIEDIKDTTCPSHLTDRYSCQNVFGSFQLLFRDEKDPTSAIKNVFSETQARIDKGYLERALLIVNATCPVEVIGSATVDINGNPVGTSGNTSSGLVIGIVIVAILVVLVGLVAFWWFCVRNKELQRVNESNEKISGKNEQTPEILGNSDRNDTKDHDSNNNDANTDKDSLHAESERTKRADVSVMLPAQTIPANTLINEDEEVDADESCNVTLSSERTVKFKEIATDPNNYEEATTFSIDSLRPNDFSDKKSVADIESGKSFSEMDPDEIGDTTTTSSVFLIDSLEHDHFATETLGSGDDKSSVTVKSEKPFKQLTSASNNSVTSSRSNGDGSHGKSYRETLAENIDNIISGTGSNSSVTKSVGANSTKSRSSQENRNFSIVEDNEKVGSEDKVGKSEDENDESDTISSATKSTKTSVASNNAKAEGKDSDAKQVESNSEQDETDTKSNATKSTKSSITNKNTKVEKGESEGKIDESEEDKDESDAKSTATKSTKSSVASKNLKVIELAAASKTSQNEKAMKSSSSDGHDISQADDKSKSDASSESSEMKATTDISPFDSNTAREKVSSEDSKESTSEITQGNLEETKPLDPNVENFKIESLGVIPVTDVVKADVINNTSSSKPPGDESTKVPSGSSNEDSSSSEDSTSSEDTTETSSFELDGTGTIIESKASSDPQREKYRLQVEELIKKACPEEIDNIDTMLDQFAGKEEELINSLKTMATQTASSSSTDDEESDSDESDSEEEKDSEDESSDDEAKNKKKNDKAASDDDNSTDNDSDIEIKGGKNPKANIDDDSDVSESEDDSDDSEEDKIMTKKPDTNLKKAEESSSEDDEEDETDSDEDKKSIKKINTKTKKVEESSSEDDEDSDSEDSDSEESDSEGDKKQTKTTVKTTKKVKESSSEESDDSDESEESDEKPKTKTNAQSSSDEDDDSDESDSDDS